MPEQEAFQRGEISGRLTALESRVTRHEDFMGEQLASVNASLKQLNEHINQNLGGNKAFQGFLVVLASLASGLIVKFIH